MCLSQDLSEKHTLQHGQRIGQLDPAKIPTCPATGVCMVGTRTNKEGRVFPHILPVRTWQYDKPALTALGRRLLGIEDWDA